MAGHVDVDPPPLQIDYLRQLGPVKTAAIYARVTSQVGKSVPYQIASSREYATRRGWQVRYILADQSLKGNDPTRPAFNALIEHALARRIDIVIVWKLDRMARSLSHAAQLEEIFRANDVALVSVTEPIDTTTPYGRFLFGILASAAELERSIIQERVRLAHEALARAGKWVFSSLPFGYCVDSQRVPIIAETEADGVRLCASTYLQLQSYVETAELLNERGLNIRGKPWRRWHVERVVTAEIYGGVYNLCGVRIEAPSLRILDGRTIKRLAATRAARVHSGRTSRATTRQRSIDNVFKQYLATLDEPPSVS